MLLIRAPRLVTTLVLLGLSGACGGDDETTTEGSEPMTEVEQSRPEMMLTGPEGCYIPPEMSCDCDIEEAACTEDVGVWTAGCSRG